MTDDELTRLRERLNYCETQCAKDMIAQDELIGALRVDNGRLRAALKPFADAVKDKYNWTYEINVEDFRAAAAALNGTDNN